jgi:hypothetical protein
MTDQTPEDVHEPDDLDLEEPQSYTSAPSEGDAQDHDDD